MPKAPCAITPPAGIARAHGTRWMQPEASMAAKFRSGELIAGGKGGENCAAGLVRGKRNPKDMISKVVNPSPSPFFSFPSEVQLFFQNPAALPMQNNYFSRPPKMYFGPKKSIFPSLAVALKRMPDDFLRDE